jgi:DNA-binding transcriptional regulator YiaG
VALCTVAGMTAQELLLLAEAREAAASGEGLALRHAARLSQSELGSVINVPAPTLSRWEKRERTPHGPGAIRWARLLQTLRAAKEVTPNERATAP